MSVAISPRHRPRPGVTVGATARPRWRAIDYNVVERGSEPHGVVSPTGRLAVRIRQFDDVDGSDDPLAFAAHTDRVRSLDAISEAKRWTYQMLLGLDTAARFLDVGCGTGEDLTALSDAIGEGGVVVGADKARAMLVEASDRVGVTRVRQLLVQADAVSLPFTDGAFDGARVDRVLLHVRSPGAVVQDMARVVRVGGRVVALEPDFETVVIGVPGEESIQRRLKQAETLVRNPAVGRALVAMFRDAALDDVVLRGWVSIISDYDFAADALGIEQVAQRAAGTVIDERERDRWLAALRRAARDGAFFSAMTFFGACGTRAR
jgi:ubiquinone/menaquinone biosynthesis C-methylase UbiE